MPYAAAIAAVAAVGGAAINSSAASSAANKQNSASQAALAAQGAQNEQAYTNNLPYQQAGNSSLNQMMIELGLKPTTTTQTNRPDVEAEIQRLMGEEGWTRDQVQSQVDAGWGYTPTSTTVDNTKNPLYGDLNKTFNPSDLENSPGYQFQLQQGIKDQNNAATARGNYLSGATLKALQKYTQDYASTAYNTAYNQFTGDQTNRYNRLASAAGLGQIANNAIGASGQNYANNASNILTSNGNAQGAALLAQGSAYGNALNTIGGAAYNQYRTQPQTATPAQGSSYGDINSNTYG